MNRRNTFWGICMLLITPNIFAQSTTATNVFVAGRYLGWNNLSGANPLEFRTNNINRMRLNGTQTNNYLGTGFLHDVSGHLGIGLNGYFDNNTPLTMLHLEGPNNTIFNGGQFRAWMRTGMFVREYSMRCILG